MNLNKVFLIGRLTQDPEVRNTPTGQSVATVRIATNRVWNDQASGQKREAVEYHTIVAWGRLGEICGQYLKKGAMALFEGRLQTRSWDDKQTGAKRYATEVVAENMQIGPRPMGAGGSAPSAMPAMGGMGDVRRPAPVVQSHGPSMEPDIPVINEEELTVSGMEEEESKPIKDTDLPF